MSNGMSRKSGPSRGPWPGSYTMPRPQIISIGMDDPVFRDPCNARSGSSEVFLGNLEPVGQSGSRWLSGGIELSRGGSDPTSGLGVGSPTSACHGHPRSTVAVTHVWVSSTVPFKQPWCHQFRDCVPVSPTWHTALVLPGLQDISVGFYCIRPWCKPPHDNPFALGTKQTQAQWQMPVETKIGSWVERFEI